MVHFGDVPACSGKNLSHPLMSLSPMHIPRESWRVFGRVAGNFPAFRHQLDVKNLLVPTPKGSKCGLKNLTLPKFNVAVPKAVF